MLNFRLHASSATRSDRKLMMQTLPGSKVVTRCIFLLCILPNTAITTIDGQMESQQNYANWIKGLRQELFHVRHYDKLVRPIVDHNLQTVIDMQFSFTSVKINEKDGTMETLGWLGLRWTDYMVTWNATSFGNLQSVKLSSEELWKPDIVVYNSVRGYETMSASHLILLSDGVVYFVPPLSVTTTCDLDLTKWPFDTQTCSLRFGPWSHDSSEVTMNIMENQTEADLKHYSSGNSPWMITRTQATINSLQFDCCSPPYQDAVFTVELQRRSTFDAKIALTPAAVVVFLTSISYWMSPERSERMHSAFLGIFLMTALLLYFRLILPASSRNIPSVVIIHVILLGLCTFCATVTLFNGNIIRRRHPFPQWLSSFVRGRLFALVCCNNDPVEYMNARRDFRATEENHSESESNAPNAIKNISIRLTNLSALHHQQCHCCNKQDHEKPAWVPIATLIDRIAFFIHLSVIVFTIVKMWTVFGNN